MIRINKGESPPNLSANFIKKSREMKDDYDKNPIGYINQSLTFDFGKSYNTDEVRKLLVEKQHNKCCFSEAKFVGDYSDVEHFRPKGRVDDYTTNTSHYPGYYWLAFDWDNLFLCKTRLNSTEKRNYFPLYNEHERNRSHHDNFSELNKLIDPSKEDPRDYIRFHLDEPISIDTDNRGKFNIDFFNLTHSEFEEARRTKIQLLQVIRDLADVLLANGFKIDDPNVKPAFEILKESIMPQAEFSSMAIDYLQNWPPLQ